MLTDATLSVLVRFARKVLPVKDYGTKGQSDGSPDGLPCFFGEARGGLVLQVSQ